MKIIKEIARILIGITFAFSGFVKAIDPLGSTYKFTDYFNAMGSEWATKFAFILAILLSVSEFAIGMAFLLNYRVKIFSWFALIFMGIFLPVTLWVAIKNPVTDCGCFGDALVISNWETFYKNVVLTLLAIIVIYQRNKFINKLKDGFQHASFLFFILVVLFVQFWGYNHLPMIDFRPYKIGVNIMESMETPEDAAQTIYRSEFIYRNKQTGKEQKFDDQNYPWQDTINWEFVKSLDPIIVQKGYEPPIHDFTMENEYGEDVKDFYFFDDNYTFILVAYDLLKSSTKNQDKINELAQNAMDNGMNFVCLTSSLNDEIQEFKEQYDAPYEFLMCDQIALKTIIRSNPGLLLTSGGTIINKWHWKDIPDFEQLSDELQ